MDNATHAGWRLPTCREIRGQYPGLHVWAAVVGALLVIVVGWPAVSLVLDWNRLTTPTAPTTIDYHVIPVGNDGNDLILTVQSQPSPDCIRHREDLLEEGHANQDWTISHRNTTRDYYPLGSSVNGMGMGRAGTFRLHFLIPATITGEWVLHSRFVYSCPVGPLFSRVFYLTSPRVQVYFPPRR
jgi:hypothetical protein